MDLHRGQPPLFVSAVLEPVGIVGVQLPKPTFPWLVLLPRHLDEGFVQGQVVPDGVLEPKEKEIKAECLAAAAGPTCLGGLVEVFSKDLWESKAELPTSRHPMPSRKSLKPLSFPC